MHIRLRAGLLHVVRLPLQRQRTFILHKILLPFVHRVDYNSPLLQAPPKQAASEASSSGGEADAGSGSGPGSGPADAASSTTSLSLSAAQQHRMPPKHEYVIFVRLSALQKTLYKEYLRRRAGGLISSRNVLQGFHGLRE